MNIEESRGWLCDGCGKDWPEQPAGFKVFVGTTRGFLGLCAECQQVPECVEAVRAFATERVRSRAFA